MKNKKRGFSLIEVVMALAVISVGVLPILSMYPSALKMTTKATTIEEWSRVNMSILDYVKSKGYDDIKTISTSGPAFPSGGNGYSFSENNGTYRSSGFENDFSIGSNLFVINTKGINLDDYKFSIYMEDLQPTTTSNGGIKIYSKYDLKNNKIIDDSATSTSSSIVFGIIKIRETEDFSGERVRDMKFIITPIENWGD